MFITENFTFNFFTEKHNSVKEKYSIELRAENFCFLNF